MRVIAIELAELHVVRMHERARRDIRGREADHHVVLEDRLALADRARRDLVAGRHLAAAREPFAFETRADRQVASRDEDVVVFVQADGQSRGRLFANLDQGDLPVC